MNEKSEKTKQTQKNSWQEDIEKHRYYYDDAFGYEKYVPKEENEETNQQEE